MKKLINDFQAVYKEKGRYDLKSQVPYLSRLAQIYVRRSETSSLKWVELLKVCNSVIVVAIEIIDEGNMFSCYFCGFRMHSAHFEINLTSIPPQAHSDRKSTRLNSSHVRTSRMPSSA